MLRNAFKAICNEASALIAGGSIVAGEAVHEGRADHAFNPAGGLHHAMREMASGFCVYNDVAIVTAWLRRRGHRVAVVDGGTVTEPQSVRA